ncbi:MAG TPA: TatD family hydrolase [Lacunisphaera sp.]|nr:TatD family hydrolase [Lacunisphaera sp.]
MGLIDTHTHLDSFARRGELPAILARASEAGLEAMVTIGTDVDDWSLYRELATTHRGVVHYTAGLHPCSVGADWAGRVAQLEGFWGRPGPASPAAARKDSAPCPVALGECGLDRFHLPKDDPAGAERMLGWQKAAFAAQLALAKRLGCPVVVHSRGAFRECVEMIDTAGVDWRRVVFHCFAEGPAEMAELVRRGGWGSFTGIITYKNAEAVRAAALAQGIDRLMLETDAPYLTPMPHRGKPNEPSYLRFTAEYSASLFAADYSRLAAITSANARTFYGLGA